MKVAAAEALAELAREDVPDEVAAAYQGNRPRFGRDYIIPVPFDPRLISVVPTAVAKAAMAVGVARRPIADMDRYVEELSARRDPIAGSLSRIFNKVRQNPQPRRLRRGRRRAGDPRRGVVREPGAGDGDSDRPRGHRPRAGLPAGIEMRPGLEIANARISKRNTEYVQFLYAKLQRKGHLFRDCQRMINQDRNFFGATMVALGDADAMVTGVTRNYAVALDTLRLAISAKPGHQDHRRLAGAVARAPGPGRRHRRAMSSRPPGPCRYCRGNRPRRPAVGV